MIKRGITIFILTCLNACLLLSKEAEKITFDPNFRNRYVGPEFNYYEEKIDDSAWRSFLEWLVRIISKLFDIKPNNINVNNIDTIVKVVAGVVILIVILLIVKSIIKGNLNFNLFKKNTVIEYQSEIVENIHEINFREKINEAIQTENYRLAVRYQYLWMLKKLTDKNIILWHPQKTNAEYQYEIQSDEHLLVFKKSCYYYDYIWYGEFDIDAKIYQDVESHFNTIN